MTEDDDFWDSHNIKNSSGAAPLKKVVYRCSVFSFSMLITLVIIEGLCRLFWQHLSGQVIPLSLEIHRKSENPVLNFELIPNSQVRQDDVHYEINAAGMRDYADYGQPGTECFHIAAVGDSFTFGLGVDLEATWPKQLETMIRSEQDPSMNVYNFGVMGYDTIQEVELIREKVLSFEPDLIIIGYCLNDVGIFSRERTEVNHFKGYHEFLATGINNLDAMLRHVKLFNFIKDRLYLKMTNTKTGFENMNYPPDILESIKKGYSNYLQELYSLPEVRDSLENRFEQLASLSGRDRIPILICIFPELNHFNNYPFTRIHDDLMRLIGKSGMTGLDLFPAMKEHRPSALRISKANHHPNPFGYEIAAREIFKLGQTGALLDFSTISH